MARIRRVLPELTGALSICAEYALAHAWELRGLSIHEVAARVGVSTNAINRFARRLGYAGYRDFSHALSMELGRIQGAAYALPEPLLAKNLEGTAEASDDPLVVMSRVFALELAALRDTWRSLDPAALRGAAAALAAASRVLFVGTGVGVGACQIAAYRFKVLGIQADWATDPAAVITELHLLRPGDVFVALTLHGASRTVLEPLELARRRGLTTICITAAAGSRATELADFPLVVFTGDESLAFGQFASRVAAIVLLDALVSAVSWTRRDTCLPHVEEVTAANQQLHVAASRRTSARRRRTGALIDRSRGTPPA
ncbi:MAG: MurR/RpiR family transcriptional regulator [Chloroflexi bacterium]|nr:MurR/RpiR family transcriptional regulator [Chloroflexota bacterium]